MHVHLYVCVCVHAHVCAFMYSHTCTHACLFQELDGAFFLPTVPNHSEIRHEFSQLIVSLGEYIRKTHYDWTLTVDKVSTVHSL